MARRGALGDRAALVHGVALAVVVLGIAVNIVRPLAPDLGPAPDPARWFDAEHLALARSYRAPLYPVALAGLALRLVLPLLAAFTGTGRVLLGRVVDRVGEHRPARAAAAAVLAVVLVTDLVVLPLSFWAGYVHEGAWGFRTQGLGGWAYDWLVLKAPTWLGAGLVTLAGYWLARRLPRTWPAVGGLLAGALVAAVVFLAPVVLEPLTFRTHPLPDGGTRAAVEEVVERAGIATDRIVVADASRRTTKPNAYISGLGGTRRVVLYDTLVDNHAPDEVAMVLAHEVGHHRNGDLPRGTAGAAAAAVLLAYLLALVARRRTAQGRQSTPADPHGAPTLLAVVVVTAVLSAPLQQYASRQAEAAADRAALELTGDPGTFIAMQEGLARASLSGPVPPRWAYLLWATHPTVSARMGMAEAYRDTR